MENKIKKKCSITMLPTEKARKIGLYSNSNELVLTHDKLASIPVYQELYILSDEEIKPSEWYVNTNVLFKADDKFDSGNNPNVNKNNKRVLATTDNSLTIEGYDSSDESANVKIKLPQPSPQFVETYIKSFNKGNIISEVMVEYECYGFVTKTHEDLFRVKTDSNNFISITKIKNSWSREEVISLIKNALTHFMPMNNHLEEEEDSWIEQNL